MNWTGHVVAAPRSDLAKLTKRPEASRTGIYLLLGEDPDSVGGMVAYIGEGDDVSRRLYQHSRPEEQGGKDFWERAILLTSKDSNLTKAHARYLESRFIALATEAKRARLVNGTAPGQQPLPESDISDMEYFISQAQIVLPVLGVNIFRTTKPAKKSISPVTEVAAESGTESPIFEIVSKKHGIHAQAREIDGEFTVLEGSMVRKQWISTAAHTYEQLVPKLKQTGVVVDSDDGQTARFTQDYVFASPSAAAAVVHGRTANGRTEWRIPNGGINFGQWQTLGVENEPDTD